MGRTVNSVGKIVDGKWKGQYLYRDDKGGFDVRPVESYSTGFLSTEPAWTGTIVAERILAYEDLGGATTDAVSGHEGSTAFYLGAVGAMALKNLSTSTTYMIVIKYLTGENCAIKMNSAEGYMELKTMCAGKPSLKEYESISRTRVSVSEFKKGGREAENKLAQPGWAEISPDRVKPEYSYYVIYCGVKDGIESVGIEASLPIATASREEGVELNLEEKVKGSLNFLQTAPKLLGRGKKIAPYMMKDIIRASKYCDIRVFDDIYSSSTPPVFLPVPEEVEAPAAGAVESAAAQQNPGAAGGDYIQQIKQLKEIFDSGILSEAEFEAKKKQLLGI